LLNCTIFRQSTTGEVGSRKELFVIAGTRLFHKPDALPVI